MRKLLIATATAALMTGFATSAMADASDKTTVEINASAASTCYISGTDAGTQTIAAADFADSTTAMLKNTTINLDFNDSYCNYAHKISMSSEHNGLKNTTTGANVVGGNFTQQVNYVATATMGNKDNVLTTDADTADITSNVKKSQPTAVTGANRADLIVAVEITASTHTHPVLAGNYEDTLTVQIGATL